MLRPAFYHKDDLNVAIREVISNPNYKYWTNSSYLTFEIEIKPDQWAKEQYVSIDKDGNIAGYFCAHIDRDTRRVSNLSIARLSQSSVFNLDLLLFIMQLKKYRAVAWSVVIGNPIELAYDRICKRLCGRVIGQQTKSCRLTDGKLYDERLYEVINPDYQD